MMSLAPRPGHKRADARMTVTIRLRDETRSLHPNNIPLRDAAAVRKATGGLPVRAFLGDEDRIDGDSIKVLWWLARRADGEPDLTLDELEAGWPDDLTGDDLEVIVDDGEDDEDDSPEA
jgi:hypothetical protein